MNFIKYNNLKMPKIKIAPSILSADLSNINQEVKEIEKYADLIHVDIMDGIFVKPITVDANFVKKIKTKVPLDIHLMVHEPSESNLKSFIDAGAYSIIIHQEACKDPSNQINFIKKNKTKACISIKPKTSLDKIKKYLDFVDMVLIMTVEPGYAGQKFILSTMSKVKELRKLKPNLDIEVDGGINLETAKLAKDGGADIVASASYIFGSKNPKKAYEKLKNA